MLARNPNIKGSKHRVLENIVPEMRMLVFVSEPILAELRMTGTDYQVGVFMKFMGNINSLP